MYFADVLGRTFHRITDPAAVRSRVQLWTSDPPFLLVRARRDAAGDIFAATPQQSDYTADWADGSQMGARPKRDVAWKESPILRPIRRIRRQLLLRRHRRIFSLKNRAFYQPVDLRI